MLLIYLGTPISVTGNYGLEPLQDLLPALTTALPDCPVVYLPIDRDETYMSVDEEKYIWIVFLDGASEFLLE